MSNKDFLNPKVEIRSGGISGKGIFAKSYIPKDEVIVIWNANYIDKAGARQQEKLGKIIMQWDENLFSIEDKPDLGFYLNHSCDSNLWMRDARVLVAKRDIKKGEELTADYALWEADESFVSKWLCQCGSKNCRNKITGLDWKIPQIQQLYYGHFSPLVNKRIENLNKM